MERAAPGSPIWPCTRWGFPCLRAYAWSGGLLPHLFTLTPPSLPRSRRFDFLWHYPSGHLAVSLPACIPAQAFLRRPRRVTRHRALWSSDFPPPPNCSGKSDSPPFQNRAQYSRSVTVWQADPGADPKPGCRTGEAIAAANPQVPDTSSKKCIGRSSFLSERCSLLYWWDGGRLSRFGPTVSAVVNDELLPAVTRSRGNKGH
jgi:hypothetical protein